MKPCIKFEPNSGNSGNLNFENLKKFKFKRRLQKSRWRLKTKSTKVAVRTVVRTKKII